MMTIIINIVTCCFACVTISYIMKLIALVILIHNNKNLSDMKIKYITKMFI